MLSPYVSVLFKSLGKYLGTVNTFKYLCKYRIVILIKNDCGLLFSYYQSHYYYKTFRDK